MKEIKALTPLRGVAALWVVSYHLHALSPLPIADRFGLMQHGYLGVDFFFVLSGFVLAARYGRSFTGSFDARGYWRFVIVRAGRMFPLHLVVTLVCVTSAWLFSTPYSPTQVGEEMLLIHRWPLVPALFNAINGPAWSISTEWLANLLFPVFIVITLTPKRSWLPLAVLMLSVGGLTAIAAARHWSLDQSLANSFAPTIRCVTEFSAGLLIYRWRNVAKDCDWMILALVIIAGIGLAGALGDIVLVTIMAAVILALSVNAGVAARVLTVRPIYWLGEVSFSIYLVHLPIINLVRFGLKRAAISSGLLDVLFVAVSLGLTLAVSGLTYRLIESEGRDWSKRFANSPFWAS